jgi:hypothetical protein
MVLPLITLEMAAQVRPSTPVATVNGLHCHPCDVLGLIQTGRQCVVTACWPGAGDAGIPTGIAA